MTPSSLSSIPSGTLDALRPIHAPPPVSWWPPAPGWWVLFFLLIGLIGALVWLYVAGRLRRSALKELSAIGEDSTLSQREFALGVSHVLKRYAICCFPDENAGMLSGRKWLEFLHAHAPSGSDFLSGPGTVLGDGIYAPDCKVDRRELLRLARRWIKGVKCSRSVLSGCKRAANGEAGT